MISFKVFVSASCDTQCRRVIYDFKSVTVSDSRIQTFMSYTHNFTNPYFKPFVILITLSTKSSLYRENNIKKLYREILVESILSVTLIIILMEETKMHFYSWVIKKYKIENSMKGVLARSMKASRGEYPAQRSLSTQRRYLINCCNASDSCLKAFDELVVEYERENH